MNTFNADKATRLHEPIRFIAGGDTYECVELTDDLLAEVDALGDRAEADGLSVSDVLNESLALFTGKPADTFAGLTIRVKTGILTWLREQLLTPGDAAKKKRLR